ncbi:MAG TPA: guanylate kinase, partial [Acinetobacter radioresistens]|nr:guanylate kinase [Acinetobacter radioresistens]
TMGQQANRHQGLIEKLISPVSE